jgi:hypothetical protein
MSLPSGADGLPRYPMEAVSGSRSEDLLQAMAKAPAESNMRVESFFMD